MIRTTLLSAAAFSLALAAPAYAQMSGPADMDQVREKLGEANIEDRRDFGGKLLRATTEDGATVFMLVSPRDLTTEDEISLSSDELRERFEDAGFTAIQVIEEAEFAVGDLDGDYSVIVMRGDDVRDPMATGTIPPPTPGMDTAPGTTPGAPGAAPGAAPGGTPGAAPPPGGTLDTPTPGAPPRAQ
jgi:hypothetical protein